MSPKRYIGKVCSKHPELGGERCVGKCLACVTEYNKEWYRTHKEESKNKSKKWSDTNPGKKAKLAADWRRANPVKASLSVLNWRLRNKDSVKHNLKAWHFLNPGKRSSYEASRRAASIMATPLWANQDHIQGMYELCSLFRKIGLNLQVDHIVPLKSSRVCGLHVENNLQLVHADSNASKGNHWWPHEVT